MVLQNANALSVHYTCHRLESLSISRDGGVTRASCIATADSHFGRIAAVACAFRRSQPSPVSSAAHLHPPLTSYIKFDSLLSWSCQTSSYQTRFCQTSSRQRSYIGLRRSRSASVSGRNGYTVDHDDRLIAGRAFVDGNRSPSAIGVCICSLPDRGPVAGRVSCSGGAVGTGLWRLGHGITELRGRSNNRSSEGMRGSRLVTRAKYGFDKQRVPIAEDKLIDYNVALMEGDLMSALQALESLEVLNTFESDQPKKPDRVEPDGRGTLGSLLPRGDVESDEQEMLLFGDGDTSSESSSSAKTRSGVSVDVEIMPEGKQREEETDAWIKKGGRQQNTVNGGGGVSPSMMRAAYFGVLDTCLATPDIVLVIAAYDWLKRRGILSSFGKDKLTASADDPRLVTPTVLKAATGLDAVRLSPQKWGLSGPSAIALAVGIASFSVAEDAGLPIRTIAALLMVMGIADSVWLGGSGLSLMASSFWKPYRKRVMVHEAGHVVASYLLGCPVRGVILDPWTALDAGIQGQAGTQFWDPVLEEELKSGKLTGASLDRYCIVLFAGIAAEALFFGQATGGESDENMFKGIIRQLQPEWSVAKMSNQARWAVMKSYLLLKENRAPLEAVVEVMEEEGGNMSAIATAIEDALSSSPT